LGRLPKIEKRLLDAISRDEDITELKNEYRSINEFGKYVEFLEKGQKAQFYLEMYDKQINGTLTTEDIEKIRRAGNG
jgi:uncharacterized membrane protein